jgi:hypothetical protein
MQLKSDDVVFFDATKSSRGIMVVGDFSAKSSSERERAKAIERLQHADSQTTFVERVI